LEKIHKNEDDVIAVAAMPLHSKTRTIAFQKLTNDGNYQHNLKVLKCGQGILAVKRRGQFPLDAADFLPCTICNAYMHKKSLNRHVKSCSKIVFHGDEQLNESVAKLRFTAAKDGRATLSSSLVSENDENLVQMYNRLRDDDLKSIIVSDDIIKKHCSNKIDSLGEESIQKPGDIFRVNNDGRLMARILQAARTRLHNNSLSMNDLIVPAMFDHLVDIAKELSTQGELPALTLGKQIGFIICHAVRTKQGLASRAKDKHKAKEAMAFSLLFKHEWKFRVNNPLNKMMNSGKRKTMQPLPDSNDLLVLKNYMVHIMSDLSEKLRRLPNRSDWCQLSKFTMSRLIIFNKRRQAEVKDLTVEAYISRPRWHEDLQDDVFLNLTSQQQELA